jgi:hypothetical protein
VTKRQSVKLTAIWKMLIIKKGSFAEARAAYKNSLNIRTEIADSAGIGQGRVFSWRMVGKELRQSLELGS